MLESGNFHPLIYWPHVVFGISSVLFALAAIFSAKGSRIHRLGGWAFAATMGIAALTAIGFALPRGNPLPLMSSANVLYGIIAGILALQLRKGGWRVLEYAMSIIPVLLFAFIALSTVMQAATAPEPVPIIAYFFSAFGLAVFGYFIVTDFRYFRAKAFGPFERFKRHAVRMALAAVEVLRAPLMSFGPPIFGDLTGPIYFLGPFLLIPLIYFLAMPQWVKRHDRKKAAEVVDEARITAT